MLSEIGGFSGETPEEPGKQMNLTSSFPKGPVCSRRGLAITLGPASNFPGPFPTGPAELLLCSRSVMSSSLGPYGLYVACQAHLSMGFSRQEFWSGVPSPSPEDLPDPRMEPGSPALVGGFFTTEPPGKLLTEHWIEGTRRAGETWARRGRTEKLKGE